MRVLFPAPPPPPPNTSPRAGNCGPASWKRTLVCSQKKTGAENGNGCEVRAQASKGGNVLPPRGCKLAPAGPSPRLPGRCAPAAAPKECRQLCRGAVCTPALASRSHSPGAAQPFPGLHVKQSLPLLPPKPGERAQGPATEERGTGKDPRPVHSGLPPGCAPWRVGNELVPADPAVLETGVSIRCSRPPDRCKTTNFQASGAQQRRLRR